MAIRTTKLILPPLWAGALGLGLALSAPYGTAQTPPEQPAARAGGQPAPAGAKPGDEAPQDPSKVVLVSGKGFTITAADVATELGHQPGRARFVRENPEALRTLVEKMARAELLAQEAERRGYDENPAVVQAVKEEAVQQLNRKEIDEKVTPDSISPAEVKAFYEEHGEQFHRPAMRRARHILVEKKPEAMELLKKARGADERAFQQLAREHSIDTETKQRGGDLRFFPLEEDPKRNSGVPVHPAIRKAAFSLKKLGDTVKQPVEVDGRWSIVRLTGIREERHTTLEQAEPSIRTRLWRQKRRQALKDLMARLRKEQKPQVFPDRIQHIDLSDVGSRPTGFAPDPATKTQLKAKSKPQDKGGK